MVFRQGTHDVQRVALQRHRAHVRRAVQLDATEEEQTTFLERDRVRQAEEPPHAVKAINSLADLLKLPDGSDSNIIFYVTFSNY